jgi:hypothetical protein
MARAGLLSPVCVNAVRGQSLPNCDVRLMSAYPSISGLILPRCATATHMAIAVCRRLSMRPRWQVDDLSMSHAAFGDDVIGESLHVFTGAPQDRHLHAAFVVQMDVQRSPGEIMMIVKIACEALR